ncbi:MAG: hypothetical protein KF802_03395 [Bdellovibrionaceae bacterium]|nr:hypothetical protein [Pseudobdellovibrionaceae bacterium]MBX3033334.1 hypothetical protein [Pseudobdellovibrionaceae bacterium]
MKRAGAVIFVVAFGASAWWASRPMPGASSREPASLARGTVSFPMKIVCSGPAIAEDVFQFSAEPGAMNIVYGEETAPARGLAEAAPGAGNPAGAGAAAGAMAEDGAAGEARVRGEARLSLRGRGDESEFDGVVALRGHRSVDGRTFRLEGALGRDRVSLVLETDGDGRLERRGPSAVRAVYSSRCMESF